MSKKFEKLSKDHIIQTTIKLIDKNGGASFVKCLILF